MHQDDVAVVHRAHDRVHRLFGIPCLPVQRVDVPQDHGHAHIPGHGAVDGPVGRAHDCGGGPGRFPYPVVRPLDLGGYGPRVQLSQIRVVIGVVPQLASCVLHPLYQLRIGGDLLPQHEKGGVGAVLFQLIQYFPRPLSRTVVKGERHHGPGGIHHALLHGEEFPVPAKGIEGEAHVDIPHGHLSLLVKIVPAPLYLLPAGERAAVLSQVISAVLPVLPLAGLHGAAVVKEVPGPGNFPPANRFLPGGVKIVALFLPGDKSVRDPGTVVALKSPFLPPAHRVLDCQRAFPHLELYFLSPVLSQLFLQLSVQLDPHRISSLHGQVRVAHKGDPLPVLQPAHQLLCRELLLFVQAYPLIVPFRVRGDLRKQGRLLLSHIDLPVRRRNLYPGTPPKAGQGKDSTRGSGTGEQDGRGHQQPDRKTPPSPPVYPPSFSFASMYPPFRPCPNAAPLSVHRPCSSSPDILYFIFDRV